MKIARTEAKKYLTCQMCGKGNLVVGLIVFTRGEYGVYCKDCIKSMLKAGKYITKQSLFNKKGG